MHEKESNRQQLLFNVSVYQHVSEKSSLNAQGTDGLYNGVCGDARCKTLLNNELDTRVNGTDAG